MTQAMTPEELAEIKHAHREGPGGRCWAFGDPWPCAEFRVAVRIEELEDAARWVLAHHRYVPGPNCCAHCTSSVWPCQTRIKFAALMPLKDSE